MSGFVALLRGINVGKARRIPMADLRAVLEGLGHGNVRTLLNSGNAVFQAHGATSGKLATDIERALAERFGFDVPVVVVGAKELDAIVAANPLPQAARQPSRFLVAFVQDAQRLAPARALASRSWEPEAFAVGPRAAYLWCANGVIASKVAPVFARATGDVATARNWATVLKLRAMLAPAAAAG